MLDQKRRAWLRGITLHYHIEGRAPRALSPEETQEFENLYADAKARAEAAHANAAQYSGGLLQVVALTEEQTALLTLAMIDLQRVAAQWNMPLPALPQDTGSKPAPLGKKVDDSGAL
jgi:hypothetical protein